MALALVGPTGIGKTFNLYHELLAFHGGDKTRILLIRDINQLRLIKVTHHDLIFDDVDFQLSRPEVLINLTDNDFDGVVRILNKYQIVPCTARKWFTHNNRSAFHPILATSCQIQAIKRRLTTVQLNDREQVIRTIRCQLKKGPSKMSSWEKVEMEVED